MAFCYLGTLPICHDASIPPIHPSFSHYAIMPFTTYYSKMVSCLSTSLAPYTSITQPLCHSTTLKPCLQWHINPTTQIASLCTKFHSFFVPPYQTATLDLSYLATLLGFWFSWTFTTLFRSRTKITKGWTWSCKYFTSLNVIMHI